jgi:hypothetical protein
MADAIEAINANTPVIPQSIPPLTLIPSPPPPVDLDSISLSLPAQAQILAQQGMSPFEIAQQLGVSTDSILSDLSVTPVTQTAQVSTSVT